ncbi:hypothetical protein J6P92_05955 [bacterium]|nr:hypothetical protein [bacterium]
MFSAIASSFFAVRNAKKTEDGEVGRSAVALGQTAGVVQEVAKYDGAIANTARSACSVFSDLAKQNKAFEYAGKVTKFAVNNVNPLICVSGGIKTMMSDDKVKTGTIEVAALTAMFAGEGLTKRYYDKAVSSTACKNMLQKASKVPVLKNLFGYLSKNNLNGKAGMIIKGATFVTASMSSYAIGEKNAKDYLVPKVKELFGDNKI